MRSERRKKNQKDIFEMLPEAIEKFSKTIINPFFKSTGKDGAEGSEPLRAEIFTEEQLKQHAKLLSARHILVPRSPSEQLLKRLAENEDTLLKVHAILTETVKKNNRIVPAAEWLLDNFYLIEEQIYTAKKHLPKGYSKGLPQLARGESAGLPRVYDLAVEIISHSDGHINLESLVSFVNAYQEAHFLKLGELWAIPIMLRLALLENLTRLSIQISEDISNKTLAESWAVQFIDIAEKDPKNLVLVIADMARSNPPIVSSFVAELTRRLQEQGGSLSLVSSWLEQTLLENGFTSAALIQQENQKQAADQVSISNSISSLRFLGITDWREFVERTSVVEKILRDDITGIYAAMDFNTRDEYRHAVEKIAKHSLIPEYSVASIAIQLSRENETKDSRTNHIGYYLKGAGRPLTEQRAGMKKTTGEFFLRGIKKIPLLIYTGCIFIIIAATVWLFYKISKIELQGWPLLLFSFVFIIGASQFAVSVTNWLITLFTKPGLLSRMDFSKGIPHECKSMVVVPTILQSQKNIEDMVEALEVRFLSNRDANLLFALLTDFKDAKQKDSEEDALLLQLTRDKITELNKKYDHAENNMFFVLHRSRRYNEKEKVWMGYERKRGKLGELNELLLGKGDNTFILSADEKKALEGIKYVITLDADTQLPRDAAWKMIATMAHPLNRPVYNEKKKRVTDGYTILQPRVSNSLPANGSSAYMKAHGNEPGTDPYTKATSDVYQDMFEEGSYIGKGIYEVATFQKVLHNKFPENRILSHDLLEGAYARAGLITDVQLYEEYPSSYLTDMARRHRWVRGDWQIAHWVLPFAPAADNKLHKNTLSLLSKWKIADNLRRSFIPFCYTAILLYGWIFSSYPWIWTAAVLVFIFCPTIISFIVNLSRRPAEGTFLPHLNYTLLSFKDSVSRQLIDFIFLPYEVILYADAIVRTVWRIIFSRKKLLQWNPYNQQPAIVKVAGTYRKMWFAPLMGACVFIYLFIHAPFLLSQIFIFPLAWIMSPWIAWYISRSSVEKSSAVTVKEKTFLRQLARKIYAFFETFVTSQDNWLPPDNYQEAPVERIAHRTSPTNIGMSLLVNVTAYDFGYITTSRLIQLTANTIGTMEKMEKYRGHLYNWYDTLTLEPLHPKYISTVDSGNLVGHLVTLQQALLSIKNKKIITADLFDGLTDETGILRKRNDLPGLPEFEQSIAEKNSLNTDDLNSIKNHLSNLQISFLQIAGQQQDLDDETNGWVQKIILHIEDIQNELYSFFPWLLLKEAPAAFTDLFSLINQVPSLNEIPALVKTSLQHISELAERDNTPEEKAWLHTFRTSIIQSGKQAEQVLHVLDDLAARVSKLANVDYDFLYDRTQHLLTIGYNAEEHRRDNSYYDLLASEARLTTFMAIAQGKLPQQSWFSLGRQLTHTGTTPILLSWSGSMFEYLMPLLVMPSYENTLLHQTSRAVIQKQIDYGRKHGIPWGISESGYNMLDAQMNYQYRAFGVPGLGFKRGLGEDLVISPYSTVMSLMVLPKEAIENLFTLQKEGFEGRYGFYEAVDYTRSRLLRKQNFTIIQSFMAHHQGMSLLSISHLLHNKPMQQRFEADVQVKSALLLLQERIPRVTSFYSPSVHEADTSITLKDNGAMRVLDTADTNTPEVQLLSNGRYNVMITNAGGGYSHWKNLALTRWREDCTCDNWGTFCFIRDMDMQETWSTAFQPTLQQADTYEAVFSQGRAEFRRRDHLLEMHTEIVVSPEDDIELRRLHLTNRSRKRRVIEITSYAEVVLAPAIADEMHPAFSNLFIQTQINEHRNAIVCTRRPRSQNENNPYMFHLMKVHDAAIKNISYETDREKFIGRGRTIHQPAVIQKTGGLSGSDGSVLDPVVAIQYRIVLESYETATVDMIFGIAETKETCNALIEKYQDRHLINRILELAWIHSQVILRQINATEPDAQLYSRLASSIIYANASLRTDPSLIIKNQKGQQSLWTYSISGDLPVVLVQIEDGANIDLVRQMVQAHTYWRLKGLIVDLIIWNEDHGGYRQDLQNQIINLVSGSSNDMRDKPGGIFIRAAEQIPNEDRVLFQSIAHIVIADKWGTLEEQMNNRIRFKTAAPYFTPVKTYQQDDTGITIPGNLQYFNGYGGFSPDGKEYVIATTANQPTPAPWINVIANPQFGCIVTESGQSYTWMENAHVYRLTPWNNDPVSDLKGEAFYIRDEESGYFWSPTPLPATGKTPYITRHGFGYSLFQHKEDGIETEMCMYADIDAPVKFIVLKIRNTSQRRRRLSAIGYIEWVLGDLRSKSLKHIVTEMDTRSGAILAGNSYSNEMGSCVAFFDVDDPNRSFTADRSEFIGRNGTISNPDALKRKRLSGKTGAALDPCAAIQVAFDLAEDEDHQIVFRLGAGKNKEEAMRLIQNFEGSVAAQKALDKVNDYWVKMLSAVTIETPDTPTNLLTNGWLNYQALACRFWGRSGFYQSGGAFGFRDQLQDVLSLLHCNPAAAKQQLLLCASRQFKEGDVQHWWHPPSGRGVRTTCSDDFLWLPFVTYRYVETTGDTALLDEQGHFLEGRLLNAGEESYYDLPIRSDQQASLYQHCVKAIEKGLHFGEHGLPLIGSGDWNDGMDKVGHHGKGESVWLAFFLYDILIKFADLATQRNDTAFAATCNEQAALLKANIHRHAWDGDWYRRGYFDDGTPLGSISNDECKIDSIAQSWSVISNAGDSERKQLALQSAEKYLVKKEGQYIQLFDPPFDTSALNPGYIKGYVPGVRENGGQYTHAAIWLVMAFAAEKNKAKTWELLQMINPVNHGSNNDLINVYKTEPYVMAADIYAVEHHKGRGGWTWYTGSAGWMYQLILESFIGLKRRGDQLSFSPCLPTEWPSVKITYRYLTAVYHIELLPHNGAAKFIADGKEQDNDAIQLIDDGNTHEILFYYTQ